jgi:hypothetical protein
MKIRFVVNNRGLPRVKRILFMSFMKQLQWNSRMAEDGQTLAAFQSSR